MYADLLRFHISSWIRTLELILNQILHNYEAVLSSDTNADLSPGSLQPILLVSQNFESI